MLALVVLAAGCEQVWRTRVSEAEFGGEYVVKLCDEWERCNEDDGPCPFSAAEDTTTGVINDCDFDPDAAQECLDAGWICGMVEGTVVPVDACDEVCG